MKATKNLRPFYEGYYSLMNLAIRVQHSVCGRKNLFRSKDSALTTGFSARKGARLFRWPGKGGISVDGQKVGKFVVGFATIPLIVNLCVFPKHELVPFCY